MENCPFGKTRIAKVKTVMEAELKALRWAIITMSRLQYRKIIFESDAQELIKILNSGEVRPHINPSLQDIKIMLQQFEEVKFVYSPRGGNEVADIYRIAKESLSSMKDDPTLYSIVLVWLKSLVESDVVL
ncbi:predicted protein [Arabidopsis lyrata subsp. lyrata]|uniref:Predicted protein n=1 Tax=Arabidopsis lyrata subsp. lyrata TaxID=81972 RepID=D7MUF5_ARALL|nr:predicted protein [Arabidopsis lyrata subsp. lyrata]